MGLKEKLYLFRTAFKQIYVQKVCCYKQKIKSKNHFLENVISSREETSNEKITANDFVKFYQSEENTHFHNLQLQFQVIIINSKGLCRFDKGFPLIFCEQFSSTYLKILRTCTFDGSKSDATKRNISKHDS